MSGGDLSMAGENDMTDSEAFPTEAQVVEFMKLRPLLKTATSEVKEFSKKKPDGVMSALKVRLLNRLLGQLQEAMAAGPATEYLDLLDEGSLPDYSDAVLILSQYEAAMNAFSQQFHGSDTRTGPYETRWFTLEDPPETEDEDWEEQ